MVKKTLNITGTSGTVYDLDAITAENRTNSTAPLVVQVFEYTAGNNPNPTNLQVGQMWMSKKVTVSK